MTRVAALACPASAPGGPPRSAGRGHLVDAMTGTRRWSATGRGRFVGDAVIVDTGRLACTRALSDGAFRGCVIVAATQTQLTLGQGTLRADDVAWATDRWRLLAGEPNGKTS